MIVLSLLISLAALANHVSAEVTVYAPTGAQASATAFPCIGAVPCDGNVVENIPTPAPTGLTTIAPVQLYSGGVPGVSIPLDASFFGFSVELSVSNQIIGNDGLTLQPNFLNLMATMVDRAGKVLVRVGGNTQETAVVEPDGLPGGLAIEKFNKDTFTPTLLISPNLLYAMANASQLLNIKWFLGLPFNDTTNPRLILGELAESILANDFMGFQLGNEPDLYYENALRAPTYTPDQYTQEWGQVVQDYVNDANFPNKPVFIGPSICCGRGPGWTPEEVWNTGYLDDYAEYLAYISVQYYPANNCNDSGIIDPNTLLSSTFGNHDALINDMTQYTNTSALAQQYGKPLIMFETNTASCGGFSGLSDSFGSTLWSIDYALLMAYNNFSNALWHVGGVDDYYNPFTVPSGNQTHVREWTVGSTFYASLFVAETLGTSGKGQIIDLALNNNQFSPGYAVYEEGVPQRVALINYLSDPNANYTAYISVGGNTTGQTNATPASVQVKYMLAPSANDKWNITWAGQTFGGPFEADGRLQGDEFIYTIACDQANNVCPVTVPAPGAAIVFLNSDALAESGPTATLTFATTTSATGVANTATVNQAVLETSNGRGGGVWEGSGSTSYGSSNAAERSIASRWSFVGCLVAALASGVFLKARW